MKNFKKVVALVLAFVMVLSMGTVAFANENAAEADVLYDLGLLQGYSDTEKLLGLDDAADAAQALKLIGTALGWTVDAEATVAFTDVPAWAVPWVAKAVELGITNGESETTFGVSNITGKRMVTWLLRALGNDSADAWDNTDTLAAAAGIDVPTTTLRGDVAGVIFDALSAKKVGSETTLIEDLVEAGKVDAAKAEAAELIAGAPDAVVIDTAKALNSKVVEVALNEDEDAPAAVNAGMFSVTDEDDAAVAIASAELAAWDGDNFTVLVTLEEDTTAGELYAITSGDDSANFGGKSVDDSKPEVNSIKSTDYNEVTIEFSEAIDIDTLTIELKEKYGDKDDLAVVDMAYDGSTKVKLTTDEQADSTLYASDIKDVADLAGNVMDDDDSNTFVGQKMPTDDLEVSGAKANDYNEVSVLFNLDVDTTTIDAANFTIKEKYGDKDEIEVLSAVAAADDKEYYGTAKIKDSAVTDKDQYVILTVADLEGSTLYEIEVADVASAYETELDTDKDTTTFVGIAKPSDDVKLTKAAAASNTEVDLTFDQKIEADTAVLDLFTITEKYGDKDTLTISDVEVDGTKVTLTVDSMDNVLYEVEVEAGIQDIYGNDLDSDNDKTTFVGQEIADKIDANPSISRLTDTKIAVHFSENVGDNATDVAMYSIDGGVGYPEAVAKASDDDVTDYTAITATNKGKTVVLTIPKTDDGKVYELTVKEGLENSDGIVSTKDLEATFTGKGNAASLPEVEGVVAIDEQTLHIFFDRDVTDSSIEGQIWDDSNDVAIAGAIGIIADGGTTADFDIEGKVETVYQSSADDNVLIVRLNTADFEQGDLTSGASVFKAIFPTTKVKSDDGKNVLQFNYNNDEPSAPEIEAVQAMDVQTLRVYFTEEIEDISDAANFAPANALLYTDEDGTTVVKDSVGTDVAVSAIYKIDDKTFDFVFDRALTSASTNATNGQAYLYVATTGVKNLAAADNTSIQDKSQTIELKQNSSSKNYASVLFGFSSETITADSIDDINIMMLNNRTMVVYYPEAMNETHVETVANYGLVSSTAGAAPAGAVTVDYAEYDSDDMTATLYLSAAIAADNYLAIDGAVANESGTKNIEDEQTAINVLGGGLVRQFAPDNDNADKPTIASASINDDLDEITIVFTQEVAFGATDVDYDGTGTAGTTTDDVLSANTTYNDGNGGDQDTVTNAIKLVATRADGVAISEVLDASGTNVNVEQVVRKKDDKTIVIRLSAALKAGTEATVKLNEAANGVVTWAERTNETDADDVSKTSIGVPASPLHPTDTTAPTVAVTDGTAGADDGVVTANDTLILTFNEDMIPTTVTAANINTILALNNSHSHLDGAGAISSAVWTNGAGENRILTITYTTGTSVPTVVGNDTLTITLYDTKGNKVSATATVPAAAF